MKILSAIHRNQCIFRGSAFHLLLVQDPDPEGHYIRREIFFHELGSYGYKKFFFA
jgi:hypothetical protein